MCNHKKNENLSDRDILKGNGVIVGGSGLIGGALLHHFRRQGRGVEILAPNSKELNIRSSRSIEEYFKKIRPAFIVNSALAAIGINRQRTYEINYIGAMNLAKVALEYDVPFIQLSSSAVLEEGTDVREDALRDLTPELNDYSKSKLMCEMTLAKLHAREDLDYTSIRLGIVYGKYDHTIQGFHKLLFAVATGTMPVLLCRKKVYHSYTNLRKIPWFIEHILEKREEYRGRSINFIDPQPAQFSEVILTMRDTMQQKAPLAMHMPLPVARTGLAAIEKLRKLMAKIGADLTVPPELMFLENLYTTQTLSSKSLKASSFKDPYPDTDLYSELPEIIGYYLNR